MQIFLLSFEIILFVSVVCEDIYMSRVLVNLCHFRSHSGIEKSHTRLANN